MANHKSTIKRIKTNDLKRIHNRFYARSMRNAVRKFRGLTDKDEASQGLPKLVSLIDKNAKRGIIHRKKAANLKSKLTKLIATM